LLNSQGKRTWNTASKSTKEKSSTAGRSKSPQKLPNTRCPVQGRDLALDQDQGLLRGEGERRLRRGQGQEAGPDQGAVIGRGTGPTGANQRSQGGLRASPRTEGPNQEANQGASQEASLAANQEANPGVSQLRAPGRGQNPHQMMKKSRTENIMGTEMVRS